MVRVIADYLSIIVGFSIMAGFLRALDALVDPSGADFPLGSRYFPIVKLGVPLLYGVVFTLMGYSERLYHPETVQAFGKESRITSKAGLWSSAVLWGIFGCSGAPIREVVAIASCFAVSWVIMLAWRRVWHRMARRRTGNRARNVLIAGGGPTSQRLARFLEQDRERNYAVRGFLKEHKTGADVRAGLRDLGRIARSEFVDEVILTPQCSSEAARIVIAEARRNRIDVKIVPDCFGLDPAQVALERFGNVPVLTICEEPLPVAGLLLKRSIDVLLSAAGLLVGLPVLVLIAMAVKLDSPGPALYCAPRLGWKGRRFHCYKFRTMVTNADTQKKSLRHRNEREGAFFKMADDPRITRVGRFLRRYSLDELPQLWNVVRGEMSLVGPRPHPLDDTERYSLEDWQRLEVMPGLTGLWQVTARNDPSFARSMELDRQYIGRWTLGMDFRILCRTVCVVLRGEGT